MLISAIVRIRYLFGEKSIFPLILFSLPCLLIITEGSLSYPPLREPSLS